VIPHRAGLLRLLLGAAALALVAPVRAEDGGGAVRRFALAVGANDGGAARARLRYAGADAERLLQVMRQLGGVAPEDAVLLQEPGEAALRSALADLQARVTRARGAGRVEVLFYYSGHSDEEGLLVREARLGYPELRRWLEALGADVRIAILDSCASGALTRGKGGARTAPFLVDTSTRVSGHVILTSSAATEASQESDRLGASFFTHYLVSGLRGAADANQDGKITLSELYQFAFQETLARTERTRSGPQHPEWDIALAGSGEVVLTDLRGTAGALVIPAAASGRFFVRDAGERLVAELRKQAGRPVALGLDPGRYRITREEGRTTSEASVDIGRGVPTELPLGAFAPAARELTRARGDEPPALTLASIDLAVFPPVSLNGDDRAANWLQLGLIGSRTTWLRGVALGGVVWADEDVVGTQLGWVGTSARGPVRGAQISMIANVAGGLTGLQSTTGLNLVRGDARGYQAATVANWTTGALVGAQAGMVNYAGAVTGAQLSLTSVADQVTGLQLGLVNVGGDVTGAQIGLVNVARRARGAQIGLVNLADEMAGVPLGLVSLARDGEHKLLLVGEQSKMITAELLLGSQVFHGLLTVGVQRTSPSATTVGTAGGGSRAWVGFGMGAHHARGRFLLDVDVLSRSATDTRVENTLATARILAGWQLAPWAALVAGPSVNVFWAGTGFDPGLGDGLGTTGDPRHGGRRWIGLVAGVRLGP
jgi:hypothetical protein